MNGWLVGWMYYLDGYTDTIHDKFLGGMLSMKVKLQGAENIKILSLYQD